VTFFKARFWAFLGKGSSKTPYKYVCKNFMSKTFSEKIDKISMSVFHRLFCFIAFSGVSQRWVLKNTTTKIVENKMDKKSKTDFSGRFWVRGFKNPKRRAGPKKTG
jgi:hypothetical protein